MEESKISLKKAAIINMAGKYSNVIVQVIITMVLARLIAPEAFGIVAIITVFTNFFSILSDMGISTGVIQNKDFTRKDNENIFSFSFYLAMFLILIFFVFSFVISWFYNNSVYISISMILLITIFFNTMNSVPNALLLKNKRFKRIAIRAIAINVTAGLITVGLAFLGFSYYALVLNFVFISIGTFLWNYLSVKKELTFRFKFSFESINQIKKYSGFQFGFSLINYFSRNLDNLLIGKVMGNVALAYYDKAYKLMLYPITILSSAINPVLHPILSDFQSKKDIIYEKYINVIRILGILAAFISAFCFFAAEEIILVFYGENWSIAIPYFKILSLGVFVQIISSTTGAIYQSIGNTKALFKVGLINTFVTIIFISVGLIMKNLMVVAIAISISYNIHFVISYYVLIKKCFQKSIIKFFNEIYNYFLIWITLLTASLLFNINLSNSFISLVIKVGYLSIIYVALLYFLNEFKYLKLGKRRGKKI